VAAAIGSRFARCDVREQADNEAAVAAAVTAFGGLDMAFINAGVPTTSVRLGGPAWDLAAYRRAFGINVDGVFFGVNAALPALQARGRGALVLTSSLAGLTAVPGDPIYAATKQAIVGLARALGPALAADHVAVNALASRTRDQRGMSKPACLADQARWDTRLGSRLGDAHFAHVIAGVFPAAHVNDLASCMPPLPLRSPPLLAMGDTPRHQDDQEHRQALWHSTTGRVRGAIRNIPIASA
jgi:NAD(P)-dependent dehydrogenase (short-subunit alcohol dehydrogenase family)